LDFNPDLIRYETTFPTALSAMVVLVHAPQPGAVAVSAIRVNIKMARDSQKGIMRPLLREDLARRFDADASPPMQDGASFFPTDYRVRPCSFPRTRPFFFNGHVSPIPSPVQPP
jgi:hypothetical protein